MASVIVELRWRGRVWRVPVEGLSDGLAWVLRWRGSLLRRIGELGLDALGEEIERRILP